MSEFTFSQATSLLLKHGFELSNREWAGLFWLVAVAIACLRISSVRRSITKALRVALGAKVLPVWLVYLIWVAGFIWTSNVLGYWENALGKLTFVWVFTAGIVLVSKFPDASKNGFFGGIVRGVIGITILVEYFVNLATFSFWVELLLQPVLVILTVLLVVTERNGDSHMMRTAVGTILVLFVALLIGYSIRELLMDSAQTEIRSHALQIVWPILLTFWVLPLIYALALFSAYQMAFLRMGLSQDEASGAWKSRLGMMLAFGVRLKWLHEAGKGGSVHIARAKSVRQAYRAGREFVSKRLSEQRRENEYQENLARHAGSKEVDGDGRPLDKREFRETVGALNWLYTCHSGWYSREPQGYKPDLLNRLGVDFSRHGLARPSGITMHVSEDGRRWYAWRKTPCGRYFAIGAGGPPPDQWLYDGPDPPSDFPGLAAEWGGNPPFLNGAQK